MKYIELDDRMATEENRAPSLKVREKRVNTWNKQAYKIKRLT